MVESGVQRGFPFQKSVSVYSPARKSVKSIQGQREPQLQTRRHSDLRLSGCVAWSLSSNLEYWNPHSVPHFARHKQDCAPCTPGIRPSDCEPAMQGQAKELHSLHYGNLDIYKGHLNVRIIPLPVTFTFQVLGMGLTGLSSGGQIQPKKYLLGSPTLSKSFSPKIREHHIEYTPCQVLTPPFLFLPYSFCS